MFAALLIAKMNFSTSKNVDKNVKEKFDIVVWRLVEGPNWSARALSIIKYLNWNNRKKEHSLKSDKQDY